MGIKQNYLYRVLPGSGRRTAWCRKHRVCGGTRATPRRLTGAGGPAHAPARRRPQAEARRLPAGAVPRTGAGAGKAVTRRFRSRSATCHAATWRPGQRRSRSDRDAVRARQQPATRADAERVRGRALQLLIGDRRVPDRRPASACRRAEQPRPGPSRSTVERPSLTHTCASRPPRSTCARRRIANRAVGNRRARDVVRGHRPALGLVAVEQILTRPAVQHPHEPPAKIEPVTDRGVHAGSATGRDAVRGIAGQEHVPFAKRSASCAA